MDETFLKAAYAHYGFHLVGIKWVQDKVTGLVGMDTQLSNLYGLYLFIKIL